ncbi:rhomboid family intramembrane serine protease [Periweissella cryptocerci]|uniref:Rhomboid family intramembrane serine protease n=2 Tax=Periweissella cryptocerci TaxID=2506420 RepID=A0A4V1AJ23_9LACO|nr:rhomboid family intramembrane serine protease [Periweissella cryptocerci]QBO37505.1 rhomboid family intramembrane serine protease [Periweissella cryptocerci]
MTYYWNRFKLAPFVTYILVIMNVIVFGLMTLTGGTTSIENLIRWGADYAPLIIEQGQWYRLINPIFIHIGMEHILLNMITLFFIGNVLERIFGHWRFIVIYMIAGIGGNIASAVFAPESVAAGASTAIFGLFGAFLMVGESFWENPYVRRQTQTFIIFIILNLASGFVPNSGMDNFGHLGGLFTGFLAAYMVSVPKSVGTISKYKRILGVVLLLAIVFVAMNFGLFG